MKKTKFTFIDLKHNMELLRISYTAVMQLVAFGLVNKT